MIRIITFQNLINVISLTLSTYSLEMTNRMKVTDQPFIENVLEKYASIPDIKILALGSSYWKPPIEALQQLDLCETEIQKYGAILGYEPLRMKIKERYHQKGLDVSDLDVVITAGANQAFFNIALALCDNHQPSVIIAPYYFCHKTSLQLVGSTIYECSFDPDTFKPNWSHLEQLIKEVKPVMVVVTSPSNPSGAVWNREDYNKLISICQQIDTVVDTSTTTISSSCSNSDTDQNNSKVQVDSNERKLPWIIVDQTYEEFIYNTHHDNMNQYNITTATTISDTTSTTAIDTPTTNTTTTNNNTATKNDIDNNNNNNNDRPNNDKSSNTTTIQHILPCSTTLHYPHIIHLSSFSKAYGMPGWRVGYTLAPKCLTDSFRKIQDTIPTCAPMIAQKLAYNCMILNEEYEKQHDGQFSWVKAQVDSLKYIREEVYQIVSKLGTIQTDGAFYYLVPVPSLISEEEAVDILATQYKILLMPGYVFGAPGYMRLSYGSISPQICLEAMSQLNKGIDHLLMLSQSRNKQKQKS